MRALTKCLLVTLAMCVFSTSSGAQMIGPCPNFLYTPSEIYYLFCPGECAPYLWSIYGEECGSGECYVKTLPGLPNLISPPPSGAIEYIFFGPTTYLDANGNLITRVAPVDSCLEEAVAPSQLPNSFNSINSCFQKGASTVDMDKLSVNESIALVGVPFSLNYSSDHLQPGFSSSMTKFGMGGWLPSILHYYDVTYQVLYTGDGGSEPVQAASDGSGYYVSSQDASEVYYFDLNGNHLYTKDALTGVAKYSFNYDSHGRLVSVADQFNNTTTFAYTTGEVIMTSPYGQQTTMTFDSNGYLASVTNPNNETYRMTNGSTGLLATFEKPMGETSTIMYDSNGRVTKDLGAGGNSINLSQQFNSSTNVQTVTSSSTLGRQTIYQTTASSSGSTHSVDFPTGEVLSANTPNLGAGSSLDSIGVSTTSSLVADPRFGAMSPYDQSFDYTVANSNINLSTQENIQATLSNPSDPLSLESLVTTRMVQNDSTRTSTETFTAATRTLSDVSALDRLATTTFNLQGETQSLKIGNLVPTYFSYDERGRLTRMSVGTSRNMTFKYDNLGNVASITNFVGQTTKYNHDNAGRITEQILPDGSAIKFGYDLNGDVTSVTPPSRPAHEFGYNLFDLLSLYSPPALNGSGTSTTYSYNADKQLTSVNLPTAATINYNYDTTTGLLDSISTSSGNFTYAYMPNSNLVSQIVSPDNEYLSYQYAGRFVTNESSSGKITSNLNVSYNSNGTAANIAPTDIFGNGTVVDISYDKDGLVIGDGDLGMTRDQNGLVTTTSLQKINESIGYSAYGEMTSDQFVYASQDRNHHQHDIFNYELVRDKLGRVVTANMELSAGDSDKDHGRFSNHDVQCIGLEAEYIYDNNGRLISAMSDHQIDRYYKYDQNGNRLEKIEGGRIISATYNSQDELVKYGDTTYTYDANGELVKKSVDEDQHESFWNRLAGLYNHFGQGRGPASWHDDRELATMYSYDSIGELKTVTLPDGRVISYVYDGQGRRVGKEINGKLVAGFVYQSQTQIAAVLDGQGHILKQFVYGSKPNVPDYMIMEGRDYRIISNQVGTPLYVVDATTGRIVESENMDEFGYSEDVIHHSVLPFGFAGGLADNDTGVVHFGARDYDPQTGRWTSRDPMLFGGGDANLYEYSLNDPINFVDSNGNQALGFIAIVAIVGTASAIASSVANYIVTGSASSAAHAFAVGFAGGAVAAVTAVAGAGAAIAAGAAAVVDLGYGLLTAPSSLPPNSGTDFMNGVKSIGQQKTGVACPSSAGTP